MMKKDSLSCMIDNFVSLAGRKRYMFHGSPISNLASIMSQGLIPDPKKRYWNSEEHSGSFAGRSLQSYGGIYLADNFQSARAAVQDVKKAIIVVSISEGSLISDEDDLDKLFIDDIVIGETFEPIGRESAARLYIGFKKKDPLFVDIYEKLKKDYMLVNLKKIKETIGNLHPKLLSQIEQVMESGFDIVLKRIVSYTQLQYSARAGYFEDIAQEMNYSEPAPNPAQAETEFKNYADSLTRLFKTAFGARTARVLTPIRFSGANKIVAIFIEG